MGKSAKIVFTVIVSVLMFTGGIVAGLQTSFLPAYAAPDKTLESECAKKEKANDIDHFFCLAIFGLQRAFGDFSTDLQQVIDLLTNPRFGLEEIKEEVSTIETEVLSEEHGLAEIKNEIRDIETRLGGVEQSLERIELALEPPPDECSNNQDCTDQNACTADICRQDGTCAYEQIVGCCTSNDQCSDDNPCTQDFCGQNGICGYESIPGCVTDPSQCGQDTQCASWAVFQNNCVQQFDPAGTPCIGGLCDGSGVCVQTCSPAPEVCNGLDDDCNGAIDDGNLGGGQSCNTGQLGVCAPGTLNCSAGSLACTPNVSPTDETCNAMDDDCDGQADEGNPGGGGACDGADTDLCLEGTRTCSSGALVCSDNTGSALDVCNGLNDDCDPSSSDGSEDPQTGTVCDGPDTDFCPEGIRTCSGGALSCTDNTSNTAEVCGDGVDNDCDGTVDEGCPP